MSRILTSFIACIIFILGGLSCATTETQTDSAAPREKKPAFASNSSRSRVTRTVEMARPRYEEGYEEPKTEEAPPEEAVAKAEEPAEKTETSSEDAAEARRKAVIAGDKKTALSRLPAASQEDQKVIDDLENLKNRKQGRDALSGDLTSSFSDADEIELGKGVSARILHETPELNNPNLWEYVSYIGATLAQVSPRGGLTYYFVILDSDEVNAFSVPGGFIFITRGAIEFCSNEAELAAILAHELGHVSMRHAVRSLDKAKYRFMMKDALAELDEQQPERAEAFKKLVEELTAIGDDFYAYTRNPYNQVMEKEADRESLIYLARAGYNPHAAITLLERFRDVFGDSKTLGKCMSSHPTPSERISTMKADMVSLGLKNRGRINEERFRKITGK